MITTSKANDLVTQLFQGTGSNGTIYYYIGLHVGESAPLEDGSGFVEPSIPSGATDDEGNSITINEYKRIKLHNDVDGKKMGAASGGIIKNDQVIMFPEAENYGWGTITHFGVFTAATGGVPIYFGELETPIEIPKNYIPVFRKGKIAVGLDRDPASV